VQKTLFEASTFIMGRLTRRLGVTAQFHVHDFEQIFHGVLVSVFAEHLAQRGDVPSPVDWVPVRYEPYKIT
jgi:hypothetical protein